MRTWAIPNLNTVYEDKTGKVILQDIGGEGKLLVVHAEVIPTTDRKILRHYRDVMGTLFQQLRDRGIKEVETWVNTDEEMNYAQFFGFDEFLGELTVNGELCHPSVFRLRKKL